MAVPDNRPVWLTFGWLLALVALLLTIVFAAIGQLDLKVAVLIGLTDLAVLVP